MEMARCVRKAHMAAQTAGMPVGRSRAGLRFPAYSLLSVKAKSVRKPSKVPWKRRVLWASWMSME